MIARDGQKTMLQTCESLAQELPLFNGMQSIPGGTIYFRGIDPEETKARVGSTELINGTFRQWYGMPELYLRDTDGHIVCVGRQDEPARV